MKTHLHTEEVLKAGVWLTVNAERLKAMKRSQVAALTLEFCQHVGKTVSRNTFLRYVRKAGIDVVIVKPRTPREEPEWKKGVDRGPVLERLFVAEDNILKGGVCYAGVLVRLSKLEAQVAEILK